MATSFFIPEEIYIMVNEMIKEFGMKRNSLYREALDYLMENDFEIREELLFMKATERTAKEQLYLSDKDKERIRKYIDKRKNKDAKVLRTEMKPKPGQRKKENRYNNTVVVIQAISEYCYFLWRNVLFEDDSNKKIMEGIQYIRKQKIIS